MQFEFSRIISSFGEGMKKNTKTKKKTGDFLHTEKPSTHIEKLRDEDEFVAVHNDPDGKVIFLNEAITPNWLVLKLNTHFTTDRNEGVKCWGVSL
jgi:hypothetical protein